MSETWKCATCDGSGLIGQGSFDIDGCEWAMRCAECGARNRAPTPTPSLPVPEPSACKMCDGRSAYCSKCGAGYDEEDPACQDSRQVPEPSAAGEANVVTQLCDMLDAAGMKVTFCGECSVRGPSCTAQWCDSHELMMREGRAVVEETLTEWERVTQHFASRSQAEEDRWATKVAERKPRAAALRAFLKHVDRLTIRSTMLATQSARLREMEGEREQEALKQLVADSAAMDAELEALLAEEPSRVRDLREFVTLPAHPRNDGQVGFRDDQFRAVPHAVLVAALSFIDELTDQLTTLTTAHARVVAAVRGCQRYAIKTMVYPSTASASLLECESGELVRVADVLAALDL